MYTYNIDPEKNGNQFNNYANLVITLKGVFLALILFFASFLAPYIGCNYQNILYKNKKIRHLILFLVIYFSINLVDPNINTVEHPIIGIIKSFFVYSIFIILNNIDIDAIIIMLVLFTLLVITSKFNSYYNSVNLKSENKKNYYDILFIIEVVLGISILLLLVTSSINKINSKNPFSLYLNKCNI